MSRKGYLHGFSNKEQQRLYTQAGFLEPWIYENIEFKRVTNLLEVGCGVGAQTSILLKRFPHLNITGIDASAKQVAQGRRFLAREIRAGRVDLRCEDASKTKFGDATFDGAFFCWILEHVPDPLAILKETLRVLKPGAVVYCTEVHNASLFLEPYSPATLKYWFEFNEQQMKMKGDPFVGAKLGNLLLKAGFQNIRTEMVEFHFDSRAPKQRAEFIRYWTELLLSGAPSLLRSKRVTKDLVKEMTRELATVGRSQESVFYYRPMQARAEAL
ncbi:MAG: methyltransferase domain-containing protein [Deltaproteobacteria bacterium]|nr:methyltransferase domain-containing protein [Deltaproteobacteria bacterium]